MFIKDSVEKIKSKMYCCDKTVLKHTWNSRNEGGSNGCELKVR